VFSAVRRSLIHGGAGIVAMRLDITATLQQLMNEPSDNYGVPDYAVGRFYCAK